VFPKLRVGRNKALRYFDAPREPHLCGRGLGGDGSTADSQLGEVRDRPRISAQVQERRVLGNERNFRAMDAVVEGKPGNQQVRIYPLDYLRRIGTAEAIVLLSDLAVERPCDGTVAQDSSKASEERAMSFASQLVPKETLTKRLPDSLTDIYEVAAAAECMGGKRFWECRHRTDSNGIQPRSARNQRVNAGGRLEPVEPEKGMVERHVRRRLIQSTLPAVRQPLPGWIED
jgi:hypothetical protein